MNAAFGLTAFAERRLAVDEGSSASWRGSVALAEADARPGRYYVTALDERGRHAFLVGPFTQPTWGKEAHARALGTVRRAKAVVEELNLNTFGELRFGTAWMPLFGRAPVGKLNDRVAPKAVGPWS